MIDISTLPPLLSRLHTLPLQHHSEQTVALVVVNENETPYSGPVFFAASFPVRTENGAQPVTVRDAAGRVIPSRLTESRLDTNTPHLPPGRALWTLTLQFVAAEVPARGWQAYAATFGMSADSRADDTAFWAAMTDAVAPPATVRVYETDCHDGDLPLSGTI